MILRIIHLIGLTNLSDEQVHQYERLVRHPSPLRRARKRTPVSPFFAPFTVVFTLMAGMVLSYVCLVGRHAEYDDISMEYHIVLGIGAVVGSILGEFSWVRRFVNSLKSRTKTAVLIAHSPEGRDRHAAPNSGN
jgi:hypothetical protein